jgi:hypothetical protein
MDTNSKTLKYCTIRIPYITVFNAFRIFNCWAVYDTVNPR